MPAAHRSLLRYDFGYGERHSFQLLPVAEIELARNEPGLYAWYLRVQPDPEGPWLDSFFRIFRSKSLAVTARGTLGEEFIGTLRRSGPPAAADIAKTALASACTVFAPPLYVGMSIHVRDRLAQHLSCLMTQLALGTPAVEPDHPEASPDTDEESRSFGERVAKSLVSVGDNGAHSLFVKILYLPDLGPQQLRDIEFVVNRSYFPLFGRK
jgi:hypothetical protein